MAMKFDTKEAITPLV